MGHLGSYRTYYIIIHVIDDWYVYIMEHEYIEIYIYRKAQAIRKKQYQRFSDGSDDDDNDEFGGHRYRYRRR
jgi:hypothetical protein